MIVFIDLDGVFVDWTKGVAKHFGLDLGDARQANIARAVHELLPFSKNEMWWRLERAGRAFWSSLEEHADVRGLVDEMLAAGHQPRFLTRPTWDPGCYSGKAEWIQERFGKHFECLTITREKFWLAGPGRVLLDDSLENCQEWESHELAIPGGQAVHMPAGGPERARALNTVREMLRL